MRLNLYFRLLSIFKFIIISIVSISGSGVFAQTTDSTLFTDDFERPLLGSFWQENASWSIVDGSAYNFVEGSGGSLLTSTPYSQTSYIIETSARGFTANHYREFRVTFGQNDLSIGELYQIRYTAYFGGRLTLSRSTDNIYNPQVLDEVAVFPNFNSYNSYTFKIARYTSGLIQVYVDQGSGYSATPILEAIDLTYSGLGYVGWQVDTQSFPEDFYVDWISAVKPGTEKPALKEKPVEDNLLTQVSAKSGKPYTVAKLAAGIKQLIDRDYTITSLPSYLNGASFIQTANEDKSSKDESFLTFFLKKAAIVYIGYDSRSSVIPDWLSSWTKVEDSIGTSDENAPYLRLYSKLFDGFGEIYPFPLILGGNLKGIPNPEALTNYLVAAVPRPEPIILQAEDALVVGAIVASNHPNYIGTGFVDYVKSANEYIEWTVQIDVPGSYNLGFIYANGSLIERYLQLTDNGKDAGIAAFPPVSLFWESWAFHSGPKLFLSAGVHKIRLTSTGTSGPNIDQLSLYFISPSVDRLATVSNPVASSRKALQNNDAPAEFAQHYKAYPNPFLQSTNIYYTVKKKANVILSVYTLQGQQIQLIQNGMREPGSYQASFHAGKFSKGVYIYRLQIGTEVSTGRVIKE